MYRRHVIIFEDFSKSVTGKPGTSVCVENLRCSKADQGLFKRINTKGLLDGVEDPPG
jgi:hypothetical protein